MPKSGFPFIYKKNMGRRSKNYYKRLQGLNKHHPYLERNRWSDTVTRTLQVSPGHEDINDEIELTLGIYLFFSIKCHLVAYS